MLPLENKDPCLLGVISDAFESCLDDSDHPLSGIKCPTNFVEFLGLRDFMHGIKLLGRLSLSNEVVLMVTSENL
jgi:hypothetical protein